MIKRKDGEKTNKRQNEDVVEEVLNLQNTTSEKQVFKVCEILYLRNAS